MRLEWFECTQEMDQHPWTQLTFKINSENISFEKKKIYIVLVGMINNVFFLFEHLCIYILIQAVLSNTLILSSQSYYCISCSPTTNATWGYSIFFIYVVIWASELLLGCSGLLSLGIMTLSFYNMKDYLIYFFFSNGALMKTMDF